MDTCSRSFPQPLEQLGCFVCARFMSYSGSLNKLRPAFRLEFWYWISLVRDRCAVTGPVIRLIEDLRNVRASHPLQAGPKESIP